MRWISTDDIRTWAMRIDAIGHFPRLLQNLVRASSAKSTFINFPDAREIFNSGTDGFVQSEIATNEVPIGISVWEIGTTPKCKTKADSDYKKRTTKPKDFIPAESTFIFVTPHSWPKKDEWIAAKLAEGKWKDIRVYDCSSLAAWLENAEVVARDFAPIISYYPSDNVQTTTDFWMEWSGKSGELELPPSIVTAGREFQMNLVQSFLTGSPGIRAISAASKDEAIAFIIACAMQFEEDEKGNFFAKSLIIDSDNSFRNVSSKKQSLILISKVSGQVIFRGPQENNYVFLPLGPDDSYSGDTIPLPRIDRDGMVSALCSTGMSLEKAEHLVRESGHNVTILRAMLGFRPEKANWAKVKNARQVVPCILCERWDEDKAGDREVISELAGEPYATYGQKLAIWKQSEIPLLYQFGTSWRLASPLNAWTEIAPFLTANDFEGLRESFLKVLSETRPALDIPVKQRQMAELMGEKTSHSSWLREGLIQSMTLIAIYGDSMKLPFSGTSQTWADRVIFDLLNDAVGKLWSSLNPVMPLLAEASPNSFLSAIEKSLKDGSPELMAMFEEEPSLITPRSNHTGLLWGLESLSWLPEYLSRVTLILGKLSSLDPGGRLSNRPINSLRSIFLPWMPQTYASADVRFGALQLLAKKQPEIGRKLMLSLLPKQHDVAHPTHKTRWRLFNESFQNSQVTYPEMWKFNSLLVEELLALSEFSEERIAELINVADTLNTKDRMSIVAYISNNLDKIEQNTYAIWHTLRGTISHTNSHPVSPSALHDVSFQAYVELYEKLKPHDALNLYKWIFEDSWPNFEEGYDFEKTPHEQQIELIFERRKAGLVDILDEYGLEFTINLANEVNEKWQFGRTLAYLLNTTSDILTFLSDGRLSDKGNYAVSGFINAKETLMGFRSMINLFNELQLLEYSSRSLAFFLVALNQDENLWAYVEELGVEIQDIFWHFAELHLYGMSIQAKEYAVRKLLTAGRPKTAIYEIYNSIVGLNPDLIVELLESLVTSTEPKRFPGNQVEHVLNQLDQIKSLDRSTLARLEWKYVPILSSHYSERAPKILHEEMSANPSFFLEVLSLLYKSKTDETNAEELNDEQKAAIFHQANNAYQLLSSWKKVPGTDEENKIDGRKLKDWVSSVRQLAESNGRSDPADVEIGKILARYPIYDSDRWPPDEIAEVIDTVDSDIIARCFKTEIFNLNGFSSKSPFEGGNRERGLSNKFESLAERLQIKWPVTAAALRNLSLQYLDDAKREDERAERDSLEM